MRATTRMVVGVVIATVVLPLGACSDGKTKSPPKTEPGKSAENGPQKENGPKTGEGDQNGGQAQAEKPPAGKLTILCGGSFQVPAEALVAKYREAGGEAELSYGQSEDHFPHVELQDAGDIFLSHTPFMEKTKKAESLTRYVGVGYLAPVLVVQPGNPKDIRSIEDLAKPGLQVVLTNPEYSTCGVMVFKLLDDKGIKDAVLANVGNAQVKSHSEVATNLVVGGLDAGIMWNGVADNWIDRGELEVVPTPYEYDQETEVGVMGLSYSDKPEAVEAFLKVAEKHGKEIFADHGYVKEWKAE